MLVSAIIPTYNSADYLKEAIESILAQTVLPDEIVIVDDGSTDHTKEVCASFGDKLRYIYQPNDGSFGAGSRAVAMRAARGEWIAFLDHDDRWLPTKLEKQLEIASQYPEAAAIYTKGRLIDAEGNVTETPTDLSGGAYQISSRDAFHLLLTDTPFWVSSTLMRRGFIEEHGITDPFNVGCADWDLCLSIARHYPVAMADQMLTEYRRFPGQQSTGSLDRLMKLEERTLNDQLKVLHPNCAECRKSFRAGRRFIRHGYQVVARGLLDSYHQTSRAGQFRKALPFLWRAVRTAPEEVLAPRRALAVVKSGLLATRGLFTGLSTGKTHA
jgi:glycosyltransferase involved in cell wall biosynthesis